MMMFFVHARLVVVVVVDDVVVVVRSDVYVFVDADVFGDIVDIVAAVVGVADGVNVVYVVLYETHTT